MPGRRFGILACVTTALVVIHCKERSALESGNGPEAGTFSISGYVSLPDHTPARGAAVRIRKADFMGSLTHATATPIAWSMHADSAGQP